MYEIFFYNFGYPLGRKFNSLDAAKRKAEAIFFDCNIVDLSTRETVATFSSIGGWK